MANVKISENPEMLDPDGDDYYVIVDSSGAVTKRIKLSLGGGLGMTTYNMTAGQTTLAARTDVKNTPIEVVFLGAVVAETLEMINNCLSGCVKILVATGSNVTVRRNDSYMKTKNPLADPDINLNTGDVIAFTNIGGDPSASLNGTWLEIFRSLQV